MATFSWDFFGPRSGGTAAHFVVHLHEFLRQRALDGCRAGVEEMAPGHHVAWCQAAPEAEAAIAATLRPKRRSPPL